MIADNLEATDPSHLYHITALLLASLLRGKVWRNLSLFDSPPAHRVSFLSYPVWLFANKLHPNQHLPPASLSLPHSPHARLVSQAVEGGDFLAVYEAFSIPFSFFFFTDMKVY